MFGHPNCSHGLPSFPLSPNYILPLAFKEGGVVLGLSCSQFLPPRKQTKPQWHCELFCFGFFLWFFFLLLVGFFGWSPPPPPPKVCVILGCFILSSDLVEDLLLPERHLSSLVSSEFVFTSLFLI